MRGQAMTGEEMDRLRAQLRGMTKGLDVPEYRRDDPRWLAKHVLDRNGDRPQTGKVLEHVNMMLERGVV